MLEAFLIAALVMSSIAGAAGIYCIGHYFIMKAFKRS